MAWLPENGDLKPLSSATPLNTFWKSCMTSNLRQHPKSVLRWVGCLGDIGIKFASERRASNM
jgi:hypothetical protein